MKSFTSEFHKLGHIPMPRVGDIRIMMMPFVLEDAKSLPEMVGPHRDTVASMLAMYDCHGVGYLTIDEKLVMGGDTHRRQGLHVDGVYRGKGGSWGAGAPWASRAGSWGGGQGPWASGRPNEGGWGGGGWGGTGMLTVASQVGCQAWYQEFQGFPGDEGECEHLRPQLQDESKVVFGAGEVFWVHGLAVHESIPQPDAILRTFVRISMPSQAPWFEGYTENPLGVKPTGPILPRRSFMDM